MYAPSWRMVDNVLVGEDSGLTASYMKSEVNPISGG